MFQYPVMEDLQSVYYLTSVAVKYIVCVISYSLHLM